MSRRGRCRNPSGAGLVAGTAAVAFILGTSAVSVLLIINAGCGTLFEEKLQRINVLAANFASAHVNDADVQTETRAYVSSIMLDMGMTPLGVTVDVQRSSTQNGAPSVNVTLSNQFRISGLKGIIPSQVTLRNVEAASVDTND